MLQKIAKQNGARDDNGMERSKRDGAANYVSGQERVNEVVTGSWSLVIKKGIGNLCESDMIVVGR